MSASSPALPRLTVLISGGGTTLVNLQRHITQGRLSAEIALVIAGRRCGGIDRAGELGLPVELLERKTFSGLEEYSRAVFDLCERAESRLVILGGFLSKLQIPETFSQRVLNIHPSLIPSFCGQGMYGHRVHEAVLARGCKVSGCTVHFCDNDYDHGPIIAQRCVPVLDDDDADALAARVFEAECDLYPQAITMVLNNRVRVVGRRVLHL